MIATETQSQQKACEAAYFAAGRSAYTPTPQLRIPQALLPGVAAEAPHARAVSRAFRTSVKPLTSAARKALDPECPPTVLACLRVRRARPM